MSFIRAILLLWFVLGIASPPWAAAASDGHEVQQASANGERNLRPFTVKDRWEIKWDSKGSVLLITIHKADGSTASVGAMQDGPGSGSSYQPIGGDYYLGINGTGEWKVTVVQLP